MSAIQAKGSSTSKAASKRRARVVPVAFDAVVNRVDHGLQMDVAATVDGQQLGKRGGQLGMILPATVHVRVRLTPQMPDS
jgi:hypothetical protein